MSPDWRGWLAAAAALGVAPRDFWRLSVKEWRALASPRAAALCRDELEALMRRFPDLPR
jgi:uncharacterized phage protein (TIGR02216 family)